MFLYLGGVWTPPCLYTPICLYAPGVYTPICPHTLLCLCFWRLCMLWGVVMGSPLCWDTSLTSPVLGCLPFNYTSTLIHWFPVHQYVSGISVCYVGISLLLKGLGVFPHQLGGLGASALEMSNAHSCTFFVVHYVSHFNYGSDYYSSDYGGVFWLVFSVISDGGSFPDRVSCKLGSAWHGSTITLDAKRLWRCSWPSFCAIAANSIFNASFSLCQLCYGFSTGRFLFQS